MHTYAIQLVSSRDPKEDYKLATHMVSHFFINIALNFGLVVT